MVKLTFENCVTKLGKRVDPAKLDALSLPNKQIDDVGPFGKFEQLETLDLSNNRFRFERQLLGIFDAPKLKVLNLTGNAVTKVANYRNLIISRMPKLQILDNVQITDAERAAAEEWQKSKDAPSVKDPLLNPDAAVEEKRQIEVERVERQKEEKITKEKDLQEKLIRDQKQKEEREARLKEKNEEEQRTLDEEKKKEEEERRAAEKKEREKEEIRKWKEQQKREKEQNNKLAEEQKKKEKGEQSLAKEKAEEAEANQGQVKSRVKTGRAGEEVFVDSRSKMTISTKLTEKTIDPKKAKSGRKKKVQTSKSLFGEKEPDNELKTPAPEIDKSLLTIDDLEKELAIKEKPKKQEAPVVIKKEEDDLFSFIDNKPKEKKSLFTSNTKASDDLFADLGTESSDDLFSMVDSGKKQASKPAEAFDIDEYIKKQAPSQEEDFGLFD